ncbi:HNH endonuclease [Pseudonocardia sp. DSM 110487]|uniref:HNH endonuclease signature motif containing protein n=1 Tax=Pseudonocardia sp. DSM 110487 TaxID=2865833 RepID=UPI001C694A6D|nr:HNH endonuclease signature motif containing protein [Pseudonocardia sp. DSM 110487]QYN32068.1 HNH endonuclease [Pseudonocardia sp. DSM 110487]
MSVVSLPIPLDAMPLHDLESELLGLAGHIAAAECRFLQLLAEFDQRNGWAGDGIRSCGHWLSWRAGMSLRTATEHLRVAHALRNLPRITAAFAAGRISYSKVRAITRITGTDTATLTRLAAGIAAGDSDLRHTTVADPAAAEQVLLTVALHGTASHVETVVRAVRRRHIPPENLAARRSLSWQWDEDGTLILRGRFTPDDGAALVAAIEALVPPGTPIAHPIPPSPEDLDRRALEQEPGPTVDRVAARRADALLTLVNGHTDETGPVVERGTAQVIVHVDASTGAARLEGGPEVPESTAQRLSCDARVQVLLNDRKGNRMYLGRNRRLATPAQIAALTVRDGDGCQFPGCTHTRHLHAHHVVAWWFGGRTDIDNLILICSFHHRLVHDHGYGIRRLPGRWEFLRPDGTSIPNVAVPLSGNTESLIEMHTRARLRIDHTTLTPDWGGERLDPDPILDVLLPRRIQTAA